MEARASRRRSRRGDDDLTPRQREILAALEEGIARTGYAPTVRELCTALGLRSTATVHQHLHQLEQRGYIRRSAHHARAIEFLVPRRDPDLGRVARLRIIGRVPAGSPLLATEEVEGSLPVPDDAVSERSFALRVRGDSMVGAGIEDGDYVIVAPADDAPSGSVVVALLGEDATVKRLRIRSDGPWLEAENPAYAPIPAREARILGQVVGIYRSV
jgi:repressor LexA